MRETDNLKLSMFDATDRVSTSREAFNSNMEKIDNWYAGTTPIFAVAAQEWTQGFADGVTGTVKAWRTGPVFTLFCDLRFSAPIPAWTNFLSPSMQQWIVANCGVPRIIAPVASSSTQAVVLSVDAENGAAYLWDTEHAQSAGGAMSGSATFAVRV